MLRPIPAVSLNFCFQSRYRNGLSFHSAPMSSRPVQKCNLRLTRFSRLASSLGIDVQRASLNPLRGLRRESL